MPWELVPLLVMAGLCFEGLARIARIRALRVAAVAFWILAVSGVVRYLIF